MKFKISAFLVIMFFTQLSFARDQIDINREAFGEIMEGDVEAIRELIDKGLDPNFMLGKPKNPLGLAAFYEQERILRELIQAGGDVDHKLDEGMYFINFVANRENLNLLKIVLREEKDLNKLIYFDQFTIFTDMLRKIDKKTLSYVVENAIVDLNYRPQNGYSALYILYDRGECSLECIEVLLEECADPNLEISRHGVSFEKYARDLGDEKLIDLINNTKCE